MRPNKTKHLQTVDKLINLLKAAISNRRSKRITKKEAKRAKRKVTLMKLRTHAGNFMEAAFEPKTIRIARKRKRKLEKQNKA